MWITDIDHLQIAAPKGCEPEARRFFGDLLGLQEIEKPAHGIITLIDLKWPIRAFGFELLSRAEATREKRR